MVEFDRPDEAGSENDLGKKYFFRRCFVDVNSFVCKIPVNVSCRLDTHLIYKNEILRSATFYCKFGRFLIWFYQEIPP